MFAVIKTGGKQYKVAENDVILVEKLEVEPGQDVTFNEVLMVGQDTNLKVGAPLVQGAAVVAKVLDQAQAEPNANSVAAASIAVAEARAISTEISLAAGSTLFELAGSQATLAEHGLDRHWRNARVHTLHDPVRWKYHAIGNYYLNDENPPLRGTI